MRIFSAFKGGRMKQTYSVDYMPGARKFFKKIKDKSLKSAFTNALIKILADPYNAGRPKTGDLAGVYGYDVFYNKTNYEIAYRIYEESNHLVVIILAGTRENFYDQLKSYIR